MLLTSGSALTVPFERDSRNTAVGACGKRWTHWSGCGASMLRAAYPEVVSTFDRCPKGHRYQQTLAPQQAKEPTSAGTAVPYGIGRTPNRTIFYYSGLVMRGSADDQTSVWTITLTEYWFLYGPIFVINASDRTCTSCYDLNSGFRNLSGSVLLRILGRGLDAFK